MLVVVDLDRRVDAQHELHFLPRAVGPADDQRRAALRTQLLGIKAVVARSFERIHRSNLVGMGVLPLQFEGDMSWQSLGLTGEELIDIETDPQLRPQSRAALVVRRPDGSRQEVKLVVRRGDGSEQAVTVRLRIDTPIEVDYYKHGGILPFVLRQLLAA